MDRKDVSKANIHRMIALSYNKDNRAIIDRLVEEAKNEEELVFKLKEVFPKYETISYVHSTMLLPTGDITGCIGYSGEGVPEECDFTPKGFLRCWQNKVNRSPKYRKLMNIVVTDKKCPYCKGRIFKHNKQKWCRKYPDCRYYNEQLEKERNRLFK